MSGYNLPPGCGVHDIPGNEKERPKGRQMSAKVKARKMWAHPSGHEVYSGRNYDGGSESPVYVLSATPEAYEEIVKQMCGDDYGDIVVERKIEKQLAAIGIHRPNSAKPAANSRAITATKGRK